MGFLHSNYISQITKQIFGEIYYDIRYNLGSCVYQWVWQISFKGLLQRKRFELLLSPFSTDEDKRTGDYCDLDNCYSYKYSINHRIHIYSAVASEVYLQTYTK